MTIQKLPLKKDVETKVILKKASEAHRYLAILQGITKTIPNRSILFTLLPLQEAKFSSEIDNIITTQDDVFKSLVSKNISSNIKEVRNYEQALREGFSLVKNKKVISNDIICEIQKIIKENDAGFRKQKGTFLINNLCQIFYKPPQHINRINYLMCNLLEFINTDQDGLDPLVKMAIIHHQFESIYPFYDGNGRVGRIINILYLCLKGLLDFPILYLSRYILDNKSDYYKLLQQARYEKKWQNWIYFMLDAITFSAIESTFFIEKIADLMATFSKKVRENHSKIYSQDLINSMFKYPYIKMEFISHDLEISRQTASKYLKILVKANLLQKEKIGRTSFYINKQLIDIFTSDRKVIFDIIEKNKCICYNRITIC